MLYTSSGTRQAADSKGAELHQMQHSALRVNTRCLRRSVRPCSASARRPGGAAAVTWDFTVRLDLMQR